MALHLFPMPRLSSALFRRCYDIRDRTLFKELCTAKVLYTLNINHCLSMNAYLNSKAKCFGSLLNKSTPGEQLADKTHCGKEDVIITSSSEKEFTGILQYSLNYVSFPYCKNQAVRYLRSLLMGHMVHAQQFQHASQ